MRIIIVEDELPAQRMLVNILSELDPSIQVEAVLDSVESTVEWLINNPHPDLLFLDIHLSDGLSFNIFKKIDLSSMVIFITAYDQYALNAFQVNSIDYLLKPIKKTDIQKAINKYRTISSKILQSRNSNIDFKSIIEQVSSKEKNYRQRFLINIGDELIKLSTKDISFFLSIKSSTYAFTWEKRKYLLDVSLEKLGEQIDPANFFRTSRKSIVNIDSIDKIEQWFNGKLLIKTTPPSPEDLVVSRERAHNFKEWLDK